MDCYRFYLKKVEKGKLKFKWILETVDQVMQKLEYVWMLQSWWKNFCEKEKKVLTGWCCPTEVLYKPGEIILMI